MGVKKENNEWCHLFVQMVLRLLYKYMYSFVLPQDTLRSKKGQKSKSKKTASPKPAKSPSVYSGKA